MGKQDCKFDFDLKNVLKIEFFLVECLGIFGGHWWPFLGQLTASNCKPQTQDSQSTLLFGQKSCCQVAATWATLLSNRSLPHSLGQLWQTFNLKPNCPNRGRQDVTQTHQYTNTHIHLNIQSRIPRTSMCVCVCVHSCGSFDRWAWPIDGEEKTLCVNICQNVC